jgi:hypothetical protein
VKGRVNYLSEVRGPLQKKGLTTSLRWDDRCERKGRLPLLGEMTAVKERVNYLSEVRWPLLLSLLSEGGAVLSPSGETVSLSATEDLSRRKKRDLPENHDLHKNHDHPENLNLPKNHDLPNNLIFPRIMILLIIMIFPLLFQLSLGSHCYWGSYSSRKSHSFSISSSSWRFLSILYLPGIMLILFTLLLRTVLSFKQKSSFSHVPFWS